MQNKLIPALIGIVIIGATGGVAYWQKQMEDTAVPPMAEISGGAQTAYSAEDVAEHNTSSDCWASINGGVYDLTSWISRHPGGERAIESLCGKDGSAAFNGQHGGGASQEAILAELKIGVMQ